jgi:type II secretory pathway component PulK
MKRNKESGYPAVKIHRHHVVHRTVKKVSLLCLVLGLICPVISLLLAIGGYFTKTGSADRLFRLSLIYLSVGLVLLIVRGILEWRRRRKHQKPYQPSAFSTAELNSNSGTVLIMVLVILGLSAALVLQVQFQARLALRHERQALHKLQLQQAAGDAVRSALQALANDEDLLVDHTGESWALPREEKTPSGIATLVKISDANRFFDLNNLAVTSTNQVGRPPEEIFLDLMTECGDFSAVAKADALKDWMDEDSEGGYEDRFYQEKKPPYLAANRVLYAWDELLDIDGFSRKLFERHEHHAIRENFKADLVDCVTLIPEPRTRPVPINLNTASSEVLLGVAGLSQEELVKKVLGVRSIQPLRSVDLLAAAAKADVIEALRPYLAVNSRFFQVTARAYSEGKSENLYVLAQRDENGNVQVIQWMY